MTIGRRNVLALLAGLPGAAMTGAAMTGSGCGPAAAGPATAENTSPVGHTQQSATMTANTNASTRMPVVYYPHGGGPWPFIDNARFGASVPQTYARMRAYLQSLADLPPVPPKALLVISAHWEAAVPTVMTSPTPPMLYDYSGFPPETYQVQYPAPGAPEVAAMVLDHLQSAGFRSAADPKRGFDHGSFVPLMISHPEARIPTFQLSLKAGLDPAEHMAMGAALRPLRDQGVFIMGSGMSYHNLRGFFGHVASLRDDAKAFDDWLVESCLGEASRRDSALVQWANAPRARACHPREEHLLPLMVIAGAGGEDVATAPYRDELMGAQISAIQFG